MLIIKSIIDLTKLSPSSQAYAIANFMLEQFIETYSTSPSGHIPEEHGYIVLIEQEDIQSMINLPEIKSTLMGVGWEGVAKIENYYHAIVLINNEFAISFLIPDAPWLSQALRTILDSHLK